MALTVTVEVPSRDRAVLASWVRSTSIRSGLAHRARIVLAAEGLGTGEIVERTGLSKPTVIGASDIELEDWRVAECHKRMYNCQQRPS